MHLDSLLHMHIIILGSSSIPLKLAIQIIEVHFDSSATLEVNLLILAHLPLGIILSRNHVLISLDKFSDHVPQELHLLIALRWHWRSQVSQIVLSLLHFLSDLFHDVWQAVLNMREQNLGELGRQVANTK